MDYVTDPETRDTFAHVGTVFENVKVSQKLAQVTEKGLLQVLANTERMKCLLRLVSIAQLHDPTIGNRMRNTVLNFASFVARVAARVNSADFWSPDMITSFINLQALLIAQLPALNDLLKLCTFTRAQSLPPPLVHKKLSAVLEASSRVVVEMKRFEKAVAAAPRVKNTAAHLKDFLKDAFRIMLKLLFHIAVLYYVAFKDIPPVIWANVWAVILDYFKPTGWARVAIDALLKPELAADLPSLGPGSRLPGLLYGLVQTLDTTLALDKSPLFWMVESAANLMKTIGFVKPIVGIALTYFAQDYPQVVDLVSGYAESVIVLYLAQFTLKWFLKWLGAVGIGKLFDFGRQTIVSLLYGKPPTYSDQDVVGYQCANGVCEPFYKGQQTDSAMDLFVTFKACQRACTPLRGGYQGAYFGHC